MIDGAHTIEAPADSLLRCRLLVTRVAGRLTRLTTLLPLVWIPVGGWADLISLNPVADTFILDTAPTNNNGGTQGFTVGRDDAGGTRRGLLRFDLSSIPVGSTITSAVLELTVTKDPPLRVDRNFHLYRLLQNWGEGDKEGSRPGNNGALATTGECSWNSRRTGIADWTTPGAHEDAEPLASATTFVAGTGSYTWTNAGVMNDVKLWTEQAAQNFGWLIVCSDELTPMTARKFGSREPSPNPAPPVLHIGFVAAPVLSAPMIIQPFGLQFTVTSLPNTTNIVQVSTNLSDPSAWMPLETRVPTNTTFTVTDTNAATGSTRLYRVVRQ